MGLTLEDVKRVFAGQFASLEREGYFQEHLGFDCVDEGFLPGLIGTDIEAELVLSLRKPNLWPVHLTIDGWSEDDLFDMLEFLYDHISKPTERCFHPFNNCGWHCSEFDREAGRVEYRQKINRLLNNYGPGFELSEEGEVLALSPTGLDSLVDAPLPHPDEENVQSRVHAAIKKFRRHRATVSDRRDAIRDLADVLEFLRPQLKNVLRSQDEQDLFNIANNFGLRHHRPGQKVDYNMSIWFSWIFYYYLATIHAAVRLIDEAPDDI